MRSDAAEAVLHVSPEGSVEITPPGVNATERGTQHVLTCSARGGPGNMFSWVKQGEDGTTISESPEYVIGITDASVGGTYECTVGNEAGSGSAAAVVNVIAEFTMEPDDENVTRTEDLELICSAEGFPTPTIEWLHNSTAVENDNDTVIMKKGNDVTLTSTLTVMNTSFNDSGDYRCIAMSPVFDDVRNREARVLIQGELSLLCG
jgi:hypothetical protein